MVVSDYFSAVVDGDIQKIEEFLKNGMDINLSDPNGITALMHAARLSKTEVASFLVEKNIRINASDDSKWTALYQACMKDNFQLVKFLLEHGAIASARTIVKRSPLQVTLDYGYLPLTLLFTERGYSLDKEDRELLKGIKYKANLKKYV